MEHVRALLKGFSNRNVFCIELMVICACGLLPNPAKVPNFQYRALLGSLDQKFHGDDEKPKNPDFVSWLNGPRPKSGQSPKIQK
jgi:hypothetical protein